MPSPREFESEQENPQSEGLPSSELICGVERGLVEAFLRLIKDNYKKADKATFFLEQRTGIVNLQGVTNVRDVLSHLATMLEPGLTKEQREEQIGNAAEHLRRAAIEPYEIALNELFSRFAQLYEKYKEDVLPAKDTHVALSGAPPAATIEARLREIQGLSGEARHIKVQNIWDSEWEHGVARYIEAFDKLSALYSDIESYWYKYEQIERDSAKSEQVHALELKIRNTSRELTLQYRRARRFAAVFAAFSLLLVLLLLAVWLKR
jgi:hypothetical protein